MYNVTLWQCIIPSVHFVQLPIIHLNPIQPLPPTHPPWITETINLEKQWENFWIFTPVLPIFKKKKTWSAVIANAVPCRSLWKGHCEILGLLCLTVNNVTILLGRVRSDQIEMTYFFLNCKTFGVLKITSHVAGISDIREREKGKAESIDSCTFEATHCPPFPPWLLTLSPAVAQMVLFHFPNDLPNQATLSGLLQSTALLQSKTANFNKCLLLAFNICTCCLPLPSLLALAAFGSHLQYLQYLQYVDVQQRIKLVWRSGWW